MPFGWTTFTRRIARAVSPGGVLARLHQPPRDATRRQRTRRVVTILASGALGLLLVGATDLASGEEVGFSLFYVVPISLVAWSLDARAAAAMAAAGAVVWRLADGLAGNEYSAEWIAFWNTGVRFGFFLIIGLLMTQVSTLLATQQELAERDGLTGVLNSRTLERSIRNEIVRSERFGHPMSLAYVDLDDFKSINDSSGHLAGDEVLQRLARILEVTTRSTDIVGRIGGDEFAVMLTETGERGGATAAHKILAACRSAGIGVSIGVISCETAPASYEQLIGGADKAMYTAKRQGKGRFVHTHLPRSARHRTGAVA